MTKSAEPASRCWFTKLSIEQVVALAAAVGMTGCDLVTRLHAHPLAAPYGVIYKAPTFYPDGSHGTPGEGLSTDVLVAMCKHRGLPTSGTRYTRVHTLLKHDAKAAVAAAKKHKADAPAQPTTAQPRDKAKRRRVA